MNRARYNHILSVSHGLSPNTNAGFTLIEILIVIVLSSILMGTLYSIHKSHQDIKRSQEIIVDMNQNVRSSLLVLKNELRFLGYDPINASQGATKIAGIINPTTGNTDDTITFTYVATDDQIDNDDNGVIDEVGELATITFALNGTSLTRDDGVNGAFPIADNVENLDFSASTSGDNSLSVRVTLLIRASKEDKKWTNQDPLNFVIPDGTGRTWTINGGDHFRRQLVSTVIKCRNT